MVKIQIKSGQVVNCQSQAVICFVEQDCLSQSVPQAIAHEFSSIFAAARHQEFSGKALQTCAAVESARPTPIDIIVVGLGAKNGQGIIDVETYRRAVGKAIRVAETRRDKSVALQLPLSSLLGCTDHALAELTGTAASMAAYKFVDYITDPERLAGMIQSVDIYGNGHDHAALEAGLSKGLIIAQAVNTARHWVDLPPAKVTPTMLAQEASAIAGEHGLKITRFDEQAIIRMGMGGLAGVSSGSDQDCQLVILEYNTDKEDAPTIAFVGKGITFDSGGLSIKPAASMENMKDDMSGAAAVISVMKALAQLKPAVNVIGITPLSENLPSGKATKPGDILRFYNGKTAEVKNTDAEGRLILADALSYAVKHYKLDAIIDVATLTGACAYALGPFFTGMMSQHPDLAARVQRSGDKTGDRVWPLPFTDDYKVAIRSEVADICNIGNSKYMAGAITAGFFLQHFVGDVPWVHLDIAGTAFDVPDVTYYRPASATGASVRLLIDVATSWHKTTH